MNTTQGLAFLAALKAKNVSVKGDWIIASCPLAPWTHARGTDSNPSFGLHVSPDKPPKYSCFSCNFGSAAELLHQMEHYSKNSDSYDFLAAHKILDDDTLSLMPLPEYSEFGSQEKVFEEWPKYWLDFHVPATHASAAYEYLLSRGVTVEQMKQFGLLFDITRLMVVAPYYDVFGRLAGARGRSILPDPTKKHHDYSFNGHNNCRMVWYNEQVLNLPGPVVVVEGQFDCWRVSTVYPKVVANLTAKPSDEKFKKLCDSQEVIQIPDNDDAGDGSIATYSKLAKKYGIKHRVVTLDHSVKDPAECHPSYLKGILS